MPRPGASTAPRWMRGVFLALVLVTGAAGVAGADDGPPALGEVADAVERAVAAGSGEALASLAKRTEPDPYLVAELLCTRSAAAARAWAKAVQGPDVRPLAAYVAARLATPATSAALVQLQAAHAEHAAQDWPALGRRVIGREENVPDVALGLWRADALRATGKPAEAADAYLACARRARRLGWLRAARRGFFQGALAAYEVGRYGEMLRAFEHLAGVERARERPYFEAQAIFFQGNIHTEMGQYPEALRRLAAARAAYRKLGMDDQVARVLNTTALAHVYMGEHSRALLIVEEALDLATSAGQRMSLLSTLGIVRAAIGEYEAAARANAAALALARTSQPPREVARFLGDVGVMHTYAGDYAPAAAALQEALTTFEALEDVPSLATALTNLGYLELRRGHAQAALSLCERALEKATEAKRPRLLAGAEQNLGESLQSLGRYDEAVAAFLRASTHAESLGARGLLVEAQRGLASCHLAQGDAPAALAAARRAIAQLGTMVGGLAEGQDARAREQHALLFEVAAEAAVRLDDEAALADILESGRAMALLESLEGREEIRRLAIPQAFRSDEAEARAALAKARTSYQRARARRALKESARRRRELRAATEKLDAVIGRIRRVAKSSIALVYPQADDLAALRGHLKPEEAFVLYGATGTRYVALVIEKQGARIVPLAARAEVDAACVAYSDISGESDADGTAELGRLRALVTAPLGLAATVKRALVSPVASLFLVPVPALLDKREVSYVPSGTAYGVLAAGSSVRGSSVLALGDIDYAQHARLGRLPATAKEAEVVGDTVILGKQATEANLRRALAKEARWRAVHFACHGILDMQRPMHSALGLTPAAPDDGLLTVTEIFATRVPADLVVLSACESGRGRIYRAEGIVGLTRSFMQAGAARVICSLWKVDDAATQALMLKFYEVWNPKAKGGGLGAAEALKAAQQHVRDQPKWKAPYYWGAWVLWGLP